MGSCYKDGQGVAKDEAEAVKWYLKAAEQGDVRAQFLLGMCYEEGEGVTKGDAEAVKWYQKAAEQGHANSQKKCKDHGVTWKVSAADVIKNVDETMLADLKAKAESAKSQTIVFKSLYLGMPIQDAGALLRYYMGQSGAGKAPTIFLQDYSDGRWFREVESGLRVTASADGKVTAIYLPRKAVDKLFDTKDVEVKSFIKTFQGAYDVPDFLYDCSTLSVFSFWESDEKVDGIQPVPFEDGMQGKWTATSKKGYTVTVYDEPRVLNRSGVVYKKETIPNGSILVRKINTAAMD